MVVLLADDMTHPPTVHCLTVGLDSKPTVVIVLVGVSFLALVEAAEVVEAEVVEVVAEIEIVDTAAAIVATKAFEIVFAVDFAIVVEAGVDKETGIVGIGAEGVEIVFAFGGSERTAQIAVEADLRAGIEVGAGVESVEIEVELTVAVGIETEVEVKIEIMMFAAVEVLFVVVIASVGVGQYSG